ncbi:MAG: hypothetical protein ACJ73E_17590 [Mycobacteriales bacterium]
MQTPAAPARPTRDELAAVGRKAAARYPDAVTAYLAGSLVEGYGNTQSDLDLFVLFAGAPPAAAGGGAAAAFDGAGIYRVDLDYTDGVRVDTECWPLPAVLDVAKRLNESPADDWTAPVSLPEELFQLVHGIRIGMPVAAPAEFERVQAAFDWDHVCLLRYIRHMSVYTGSSEDAVGAVQAGDHGTALLTSREALGAAADALLAAAGSTNTKPKWRFTKLRGIGRADLGDQILAAELDPDPAPEALLARAKDRLRLASDLTLAAARAVGRLSGAPG